MRQWGIVRDGESLWWPTIARNKRSVAVDLRTSEGQDLVRTLAAQCDVVLENFRPGTLEKWRLDYATLSALNPGLIMVHVSGFGQTGPRSVDAGFGSIGEAMGGIRYTSGDPDRPPARAGISLGDSLAALFAVIGTLGALVERAKTNRGQQVDVAIYEAVAALMESTLADFEIAGVTRTRSGSVLPGVAPSNVYTARDGEEVLIAANADGVFRRLCEAMRRPELATDSRYAAHQARGENMVELDALINDWTSTIDSEPLLEVLAEHGVPAGKLFTASDMLADSHYRAREMITRVVNRSGVSIPSAAPVPKFSRSAAQPPQAGPMLGADTLDVLTKIGGLSEQRVRELSDQGICLLAQDRSAVPR